jgi:hypothetical protein
MHACVNSVAYVAVACPTPLWSLRYSLTTTSHLHDNLNAELKMMRSFQITYVSLQSVMTGLIRQTSVMTVQNDSSMYTYRYTEDRLLCGIGKRNMQPCRSIIETGWHGQQTQVADSMKWWNALVCNLVNKFIAAWLVSTLFILTKVTLPTSVRRSTHRPTNVSFSCSFCFMVRYEARAPVIPSHTATLVCQAYSSLSSPLLPVGLRPVCIRHAWPSANQLGNESSWEFACVQNMRVALLTAAPNCNEM